MCPLFQYSDLLLRISRQGIAKAVYLDTFLTCALCLAEELKTPSGYIWRGVGLNVGLVQIRMPCYKEIGGGGVRQRLHPYLELLIDSHTTRLVNHSVLAENLLRVVLRVRTPLSCVGSQVRTSICSGSGKQNPH